MTRRGLFRVLGLGAASAALAPVVAMAAKIAPQPITSVSLSTSAMPMHTHAFTSSAGARTHSIHGYYNCNSPHNHGCPTHQTGVFAPTVTHPDGKVFVRINDHWLPL